MQLSRSGGEVRRTGKKKKKKASKAVRTPKKPISMNIFLDGKPIYRSGSHDWVIQAFCYSRWYILCRYQIQSFSHVIWILLSWYQRLLSRKQRLDHVPVFHCQSYGFSFLLYSAAATACMESISQNGNIWNVEIVYKQNRIFCTDREKAVTLWSMSFT